MECNVKIVVIDTSTKENAEKTAKKIEKFMVERYALLHSTDDKLIFAKCGESVQEKKVSSSGIIT